MEYSWFAYLQHRGFREDGLRRPTTPERFLKSSEGIASPLLPETPSHVTSGNESVGRGGWRREPSKHEVRDAPAMSVTNDPTGFEVTTTIEEGCAVLALHGRVENLAAFDLAASLEPRSIFSSRPWYSISLS